MKLRLPLVFACFIALSACEEPTYSAGGLIDAQTVSVAVQGVSSNGIVLDGQRVLINGEDVGVAKQTPGQQTKLFEDNTYTYDPIETRFGRLDLRGDFPALGNATYQVFIDGALMAVIPIPPDPVLIAY
ncbi:MAG: hypothetical protein AAFN63_11465 [Pseudomonadota bacterium]